MLSNAYFFAKFRFDTAENEPAKKIANYQLCQRRKWSATRFTLRPTLLIHRFRDTNIIYQGSSLQGRVLLYKAAASRVPGDRVENVILLIHELVVSVREPYQLYLAAQLVTIIVFKKKLLDF